MITASACRSMCATRTTMASSSIGIGRPRNGRGRPAGASPWAGSRSIPACSRAEPEQHRDGGNRNLKFNKPAGTPRNHSGAGLGLIRARSVNADVLLEARDFVLYQQLAALELGDLQIVGGRMHLGFVDFLIQRLMPSFKLRKVHLNGHARCLLMSKDPKVYISPGASRHSFRLCSAIIRVLHYRGVIPA